MSQVSFIILAVFFALLVKWLSRVLRRPDNFPPGPSVLSGSLAAIRGGPKALFKMATALGRAGHKVVGVVFGPQKIIFINDTDVAREALGRDEISGRLTEVFTVDGFSIGGNFGVIDSEGAVWRRNRRFILRNLRDLGFGKSGHEDVIQREANSLCETIKNGELRISKLFNIPIINILWQMVLSKRFEMNDTAIGEWIALLNEAVGRDVFIQNAAPRFAERFPVLTGLKGVMDNFKKFRDGFDKEISEHAENLGDSEEPSDLVDAFLIEAKRNPAEFGDRRQLNDCLLDLFAAGAETTATTLKWAVLFMALNPDIQRRCRDEVWNKMGKHVTLTPDDVKRDLPYCQATICEVQRHARVFPGSVPHRVMADCKIAGFDVTENTLVILNIDYLMMNACVGGFDPAIFEPRRFIDSKTGEFNELKDFLPFGIGKRACLGDTLARKTLSVFFTTLVQRFEFRRTAATVFDEEKVLFGLTRSYDDFSVDVVKLV